jgi:hypothetical protein
MLYSGSRRCFQSKCSHKSYRIPGDERFGFDPNAFVQRLIEETGIQHVWEPVATKIAEGQRMYITISFSIEGQGQVSRPGGRSGSFLRCSGVRFLAVAFPPLRPNAAMRHETV